MRLISQSVCRRKNLRNEKNLILRKNGQLPTRHWRLRLPWCFSFSFSDKPDTEELLAPLVSLTEINSQRIEDQRFLRDSLELDLRTLKLQLASLESEDASAALSDRIDGLMQKLAEFEITSAEN